MTRARKPLARRFRVAPFIRRHRPCWDDDKLAAYLAKFEDDTWCALDVLELPGEEVSEDDRWWVASRMMTCADIDAACALQSARIDARRRLGFGERINTPYPFIADAAKEVLRKKYRRRDPK